MDVICNESAGEEIRERICEGNMGSKYGREKWKGALEWKIGTENSKVS